ncbi:hypothetical protein Ccrd_022696 [Cynara cardunculus var. scolymus]|uniref:Uncharacterized protein n=1 Tax=Cynara cardunculus var. scolymus TaxID=59895 RepID=A0A103XY34_CYNCS|nr:hypothetical protein Ccrd_022696 [Cynara cardunculus var. scolymus]
MDSSHKNSSSSSRRICLCSPTNHPGSFRCSRHRGSSPKLGRKSISEQLNRLDSKKTNLVKEFLMKIIKPSSHDLQRRKVFEPKPSRFSVLNHCRNELAVS